MCTRRLASHYWKPLSGKQQGRFAKLADHTDLSTAPSGHPPYMEIICCLLQQTTSPQPATARVKARHRTVPPVASSEKDVACAIHGDGAYIPQDCRGAGMFTGSPLPAYVEIVQVWAGTEHETAKPNRTRCRRPISNLQLSSRAVDFGSASTIIPFFNLVRGEASCTASPIHSPASGWTCAPRQRRWRSFIAAASRPMCAAGSGTRL